MLLNIDFKRNRHSCYKLNYNLVVGIYKAKKIINYSIEEYLKYVIKQNFEKHDCEVEAVKINDLSEVTIKFSAPPHIKLSALVNNFKTVSSRLIRKEFKEYLEKRGLEKHFWEMEYYIYT